MGIRRQLIKLLDDLIRLKFIDLKDWLAVEIDELSPSSCDVPQNDVFFTLFDFVDVRDRSIHFNYLPLNVIMISAHSICSSTFAPR